MAKYKFQFETGNVCDGPIEIKVIDFIGEIDDKEMNPSLALTIEAQGGQLIDEKKASPKKKLSGKKKAGAK
jgi:hypothetical protein